MPIAGDRAPSKVPAWDKRGANLLSWQSIACADLTPDGRFIALGTIAPVGDPQVFVLDEKGAIVAQHSLGERWVNEVAISPDGTTVTGLITAPQGTSGDLPTLKWFANGKTAEVKGQDRPLGANDFWHYGDHSNHLPTVLHATAKEVVVAGSGKINWVGAGPNYPVRNAEIKDQLIFSTAASPTGDVVVGGAVSARTRNEKSINLTVLGSDGKPRWQRPVSDDASPAPALEAGIYGPLVSPYQDVKAWAPLSVAISADGALVAAADYQGWQRLFDRGDNYGLRFMPTKPVIQVYTADGAPVRRFAPETFAAPGWYDLAFFADKKRLLAYPHNWASRGLGGQTRLPADDDARSLYALDLASGDVARADFPDAIASVAVGKDGVLAVSCWDGNIYLRGDDLQPVKDLPERLEVGGPCILRISQDGSRLLAAGADGSVRLFDARDKTAWRADLNKLATPGDKPWTRDQKLQQYGPGVWVRVGPLRTHSDNGNQYIIEAPDGLLLIDPNTGLSFEQHWAQIKAVGLDPMKVKYVLLTHEHGDHAPGASLWRVISGAQVLTTPEAAYTLQHHIPTGVSYGFHPPQPVDILVDHDQEMTLAGLKINVVYLPGHTAGSLGYVFDLGGKRWAVLGDLIMPGGALGFSGAVNFGAKDALASLRKLEAFKPDFILGGHGEGDPVKFIDQGIGAALATGWGKFPPEKPDPYFSFTQRNYLVVNWLQPVSASAYGDADGDGKPDVAILARENNTTFLKVFLNKGGRFGEKADIVQTVPEITPDRITKLRLLRVGKGQRADFVIGTEAQAVLLLAQDGQPDYRIVKLPGIARLTQAMTGDFNGDGRNDLLLGGRQNGRFFYALQGEDGSFSVTDGGPTKCNYDMQLLDVNADGRDDLITAGSEIFLRQPDGKFPPQPSIQLEAPKANTVYMATADFNNDGKPDIVLLNYENPGARVAVHYHTGDPAQPYATAPSTVFNLPSANLLLRDGPTAADWNGDGIPDLVLGGNGAANILLGSKQGLDPKRVEQVKLDYTPYNDNRLGVIDFTGNGTPDLAGWGPSGVGAVGLYIWTR